MTTDDKIKEAYGEYKDRLDGIIDKYGRIQVSRINQIDKPIVDQMLQILPNFAEFKINGVQYIQPEQLLPLNPRPLEEWEKEFLDQAAQEIMKIYINKALPKDFGDSMAIARLSYRQSLALLEVKNKQLQDIIDESKMNYQV